jgi:hypothetical protein
MMALFETARLQRIAVVWLIAVVFGGGFHVWDETRFGLTDGRGHPLGEDFINFWAGAALAARGLAHRVYDFGACHAFQVAQVGHAIQLYHYSYPPTMMLVSLPLAWMPYPVAWVVWSVAGLAAFAATTRAIWPSRQAVLYALAAPAAFINVMDGQTGLWTAAIFGAGLINLQRRPYLAGALLGLFVCKPQLALMLPVALAAGRQGKALLAMALSAGAIALLTLPLYGLGLWRSYSALALILRHIDLESGESWQYMPSVFVMVRHLGAATGVAYAAQAIAAVAATAMVVVVWRGRASAPVKSASLALGTLLASPYVHNYDLALAALVPLWQLTALRDDDPRRLKALIAATLLLLAPILVPVLAWRTGVALGWLLLAPALWLTLSIHKSAELGGPAACEPIAASEGAGIGV